MTDTKPTETVEDLIRQLDDRCTELSEAESMIEMLKAGATDLREALSVALRIGVYEVGGPRGQEIETIARNALRDYNQRLTLWDKLHAKH